jgi:hypothetical protein
MNRNTWQETKAFFRKQGTSFFSFFLVRFYNNDEKPEMILEKGVPIYFTWVLVNLVQCTPWRLSQTRSLPH